MTIFDVLARLKSVEGPDSSGNYKACCPAHDDKKQSLSVKQGAKGVVLKCFAGCGVRDICARLGFDMKDLFSDSAKPRPQQQAQRRIVKTYPYTNRDGQLLFEVVRYEPKSFSQRMPDPDHPGKWIWKSCPVQPLYRLPQVVKAIEAKEWVCIAEGEKDAETLARLGYCGTTIAMGAGKWKDQHTQQLIGARVLVFPDNDAPGMEHARIIVKALSGKAREVKIVDLLSVWPQMPEKADVSDLAAAFGDEKAKEMIAKAVEGAMHAAKPNPAAQPPEQLARLHDDSEAGQLFSQVTGYTVKDGCICQFTADGGIKQLSTFAAIPRKAVTRDDGATVQTGFEIEGWDRDGHRLGVEWVSSKEFSSMAWPTERWGFRANIMPGNTNKDKLRYAIAEVGARSAVKHTLYTHTGWRTVEGGLCYLHAGGAIGGENVSVQLEGKLGSYDMTIPDGISEEDGASAALGFLGVMDLKAAFPLLAISYLAPLCDFLEKRGIMPRFALFLLGQTQTRKTTAALLSMSHFGNFNAQDKIPASFNDTANSVQRSAFLLKDMPILVDDYYPVSNLAARRKMEEMAQTLSRSFGNGASRGRLNSDMTQRAGLPPRGVAIFTGEDLPDIKESGLARFYIIRFDRETVKVGDTLTDLQEKAAQGYLRAAMAGYIRFLAAQADELPDRLYKRYIQLRGQVSKRLGGARASEAVAQLILAMEMMLLYFESIGVSNPASSTALIQSAWESLRLSAQAQAADIAEQKPVNQFISIVRELIISGRFKCLSTDETGGGINVLGYADGNYYYFFPETLYQAVSKFCADQGTVFPVGSNQLRKQLAESGIVPEGMLNRLKRIRGKVTRFMWIARSVIDGDGKDPDEKPTQMQLAEDEDMPF